MSKQDQSEQMLQELRNLLVKSSQTNRDETLPSDEQINKYLTQSYRIVQGQLANKDNSNPINSRISQASVILQHQSPMIKNYVKNKIQAEIFKSKNWVKAKQGSGIRDNSQQYYKLLQIRQQLEKKRLQQKIQESKKIQQMIQSTRKYKRYQNKSQVPLPKLQSIIQKEKQDFDSIQTQQHKLKSINNLLQFEGFRSDKNQVFFNYEGKNNKKSYGKDKKNQKQIKQQLHQLQIEDKNKISQNYIIQVQGIQQDQQNFYNKIAHEYAEKFNGILNKNKNFVRVFAAFIQLNYRKIQNQLNNLGSENQNILNIQSAQIKKKRFKFQDTIFKEKTETNVEVSISELTKSYKFRAFTQQIQQFEQKIKVAPIKKVVSKRVGESNKFHNKQCLVQNTTFYYTDDDKDSHKKSDMKSFSLALQPIQMKSYKKEEGSIFQKKQYQVSIGVIKGKQRTFIYEYNAAEGVQLTQQINKVTLKRYHQISCLLNMNNNKNMEKFIESQHYILDLSNRYIRQDQQFSIKNYRNNFIKMIKDLFVHRKNTHVINLQRCVLSFNQINSILKKCQQDFSNISQINMSRTKLDKQTLKSVLSLTKKCPQNSTMTLNLSSCELDDSIIQSNLANIEVACSKIGKLILSNNYITGKSVRMLKNIFSSKVCQLRALSLSGCPIQQFQQVADLIRNSNKLQSLHVNKCNLLINNYDQMQKLMLATRQKQQFTKLQLLKNQYGGNIKWFDQISQYLQLKIDLNIKNNSSKNLQSKYLRVVLSNNYPVSS